MAVLTPRESGVFSESENASDAAEKTVNNWCEIAIYKRRVQNAKEARGRSRGHIDLTAAKRAREQNWDQSFWKRFNAKRVVR